MEVDLSATLDPFGSNQFMSCPRAMSFFQRLCPTPFPPVSEPCNSLGEQSSGQREGQDQRP